MVKMKNKKGFTLVECVVAMAVLAIMSLLLMMILTITINSRNANRKIEREIDSQVDYLIANESTAAEAFAQTLVFEVENPGDTKFTETVPVAGTNAAGVDNGIDADKIYATGTAATDVEVDILKYDFEDYNYFKDIKNNTSTPLPGSSGEKAYGGAKISGNITVNGSKTDIMNGTDVVGHHVTLRFSCNVTACSKTAGIKIVLPSGVYNVEKGSGSSSITTITPTSSDVVRIQPAFGTDENRAPGNIVAEIKFDISKSDYDRNFKSVSQFYADSNTASDNATLIYKQPTDLLPVETAAP